jgi:hypothetical protein
LIVSILTKAILNRNTIMTQQALTGTNCQAKPITDEEADIRNELILDFQETALWRRRLITKFPDDDRNAAAADLLERLSGSVQDVPEVLLLQYSQILDELETDAALDEALRWIGFRSFPTSAADYVSWFVDRHGRK